MKNKFFLSFLLLVLPLSQCCGESQTKTKDQLDTETTQFLEGFASVFASIKHLSLPEQRATIKEMFCVPENQLEHIAQVIDRVIEGRNGPIPLRLFSPIIEKVLPVIVYLHRGGWVYGSLDESEMICRRLANATESVVIAVEYRLSPEHKFPIPLEDCYDAVKWSFENAISISCDPEKIIICGESAGGNLAAAVAMMAQDTKEFALKGQLLLYPILTNALNPQNYEHSPDKFLLSYGSMQFFWDAYLNSTENGNSPYASPLKSSRFSDLPSAFIVTAEHDALKHEGADYYEALKQAQVGVKIQCYPGVIHGFLDLPLADTIKREAIDDIGSWVKNLQ